MSLPSWSLHWGKTDKNTQRSKYRAFQTWIVLRKTHNEIQGMGEPRGRSGSHRFIQGGWRSVQWRQLSRDLKEGWNGPRGYPKQRERRVANAPEQKNDASTGVARAEQSFMGHGKDLTYSLSETGSQPRLWRNDMSWRVDTVAVLIMNPRSTGGSWGSS